MLRNRKLILSKLFYGAAGQFDKINIFSHLYIATSFEDKANMICHK